jgi:quercetin dioxygenase-like cupin family protein
MLVTGGKGYFQEEGKPVQVIQEGDVVKIHPNVKHWMVQHRIVCLYILR